MAGRNDYKAILMNIYKYNTNKRDHRLYFDEMLPVPE
jgi:hypothetical protein